MSEALPYIGLIVGAFTPIGPSYGFMIGPLLGHTATDVTDATSRAPSTNTEPADDDRQHSS